MNIIPLFDIFLNNFRKIFDKSDVLPMIEHKIDEVGFNFTIETFTYFLEQIDLNFLHSKKRKDKYYCKEIVNRTIITCFGPISFKYRVYVDKITKKRYSIIKDLLLLKPYQRITDEAEYEIIKYAMSENMSQAGRHAIKNTIISRSTVSKKIKNLNGSIHRPIQKAIITPKTLYIEMDEIHANLQHGGNRICPCAIVHEGYKELFVKRKKLKNIHYFSTAKYDYKYLWNEIYNYIDNRYDLNKIDYLFVSGDGAKGIKAFDEILPNAIFVLDKFHFKKYMKYIFQNQDVINIALSYLLHDDIKLFNTLVNLQIEKRPENAKAIKISKNYIINNIQGIKNQYHPEYKCPCSMEAHVNHGFARYITSSPYGFSLDGLENKLKLLTLHANKVDLSFKDFLNLKYNNNAVTELNERIHAFQNIKFKYSNLLSNKHINSKHDTYCPIPKFEDINSNIYLNNLLNKNLF